MNATQLIADIKRQAQITSDSASWADSDILDAATKELQQKCVPKIMSVRERFFSRSTDFVVSSTRNYRIPPQAAGNKLFQVEYISSTESRDLEQTSPSQHSLAEGFFIRNNDVVLTDASPETGTLRMHYPMRCGELTETKFVVTVDSSIQIAATGHGLAVGDLFSTQKPSSPFEYTAIDLIVLTVPDANHVTVASTSAVGTGDYLTRQKIISIPLDPRKSFFPQIPEDMHDWLSLRTCIRILSSLGHSELMQLKQGELADLERDMLAMITPRVDGSPKIIVGGEILGWTN